MITKVTAKQVTEIEPGHVVCDASELGLPVGKWPMTLETDLGNGSPFQRVGPIDPEEENGFTGMRYAQEGFSANGLLLELTVYND